MKTTQETRFANAEFYFSGLQDEKGLDLLRDCVKSIMDEQCAERDKRSLQELNAARKEYDHE